LFLLLQQTFKIGNKFEIVFEKTTTTNPMRGKILFCFVEC